jgi:TetR/AcrR family tetracycline transcriptional repressor
MPFAKLDRDAIVEEALRIFAAEGLEGVNLRKVAANLRVSVSSLYWHVPDKHRLLGLIAERIFRTCLNAVPPAHDWEGWLHGFGLALWNAQRTMPDTRTLITLAVIDTEALGALHAEVLGKLESRGARRELADGAQQSVQALVTGWTTLRSRHVPESSDEARFIRALDVLIGGWRAQT